MSVLVLLSGGLDSATVLAGLICDHKCRAIAFDYGQRHRIEIQYAKRVADHYKVPLRQQFLPPLPKIDDVVFSGRNLVLVAQTIAIAQAEGIKKVAFGCNASDWARFPDCRPEFWANLSKLAETYDIGVLTPLINLTKKEIVAKARALEVPIDKTWSCYEPIIEVSKYYPCHKCLACRVREEALCEQP